MYFFIKINWLSLRGVGSSGTFGRVITLRTCQLGTSEILVTCLPIYGTFKYGEFRARLDHLSVAEFFLNGPTLATFSFIFGLFKQKFQFLQQINLKNVQPVNGAGIRTHDFWNVSFIP